MALLLAPAALAALVFGRRDEKAPSPEEWPETGAGTAGTGTEANEDDRLLPPLLSSAGPLLHAERGILMQAGPSTQRILAVWNWRGLAAGAVFPLPPGPLTFALETAQPYASAAPGENRLGFTGKLTENFLVLPFDWHGGRYLLLFVRDEAFSPDEARRTAKLGPLFAALQAGRQGVQGAARAGQLLSLATGAGARLGEAGDLAGWTTALAALLGKEWPGVRARLAVRGGELYENGAAGRCDPEAAGCWAGWALSHLERTLGQRQPTSQMPFLIGDPAPFRLGYLVPLELGESRAVLALEWPSPPPPEADELLEHLRQTLQDTATRLRAFDAASRAAETDPLTGLLNRRGFSSRYERLPKRGKIAVLAIDLDHFKKVNDTHGHAAGDAVLKGVAEIILGELRGDDLGGRLGGEELALILPGSDRAGALRVAERLRARLRERAFAGTGGNFQVTMSLGLAVSDGPRPPLAGLSERADKALYEAKAQGRDRVVEEKT